MSLQAVKMKVLINVGLLLKIFNGTSRTTHF